MSSPLVSDSIYWVDVEKIKPNPYQPRREFDPMALESLADSIRQYGVLQPLVVTRREIHKDDGGIVTEYELIAGERRLRASKLAGIAQVPVVIRTGEDNNLMKLELAIIENLQREDLNPVDRAKAFQQFVDEFGYKHAEIAKKVGKSREYVSNSLRLLSLPDEIIDALVAGKITEGHARPIMMLKERPEEQNTLFKEIMFKKLTVRDAEGIARRIAQDKVRKRTRDFDPEILQMEKELTEQLGTRVHIEPREVGGKITIDFFSDDDLKNLLAFMNAQESRQGKTTLADAISQQSDVEKKHYEEPPKVQEAVHEEIVPAPAPAVASAFAAELQQSYNEPAPVAEAVVEVPHKEIETVGVAVDPQSMPVPKRPGFVSPKDEQPRSPHEISSMVEPKFRADVVGTVAFGGASRPMNEPRTSSLGDVLRTVLAKDKEDKDHRVSPVTHEEQHATTASVQPEKETMSSMIFKPEHETPKPVDAPVADSYEEVDLPDTGIFRDEVNSVLGGAGRDATDNSYEQELPTLDEVKEDVPPIAHKDGAAEDDIYSVRNFAL